MSRNMTNEILIEEDDDYTFNIWILQFGSPEVLTVRVGGQDS